MDELKSQNNKEINQYYEITEEDLKNGEITVFVLKDGKHLYALKYGKKEDKMAIIALATIDAQFDDRDTRAVLVNKMYSLKIHPKISEIEKIEKDYQHAGFEMTSEGKEIFSKGSEEYILKSILQTVKYDTELSELKEIEHDQEEADVYRNYRKLEQYLVNLKKIDKRAYDTYVSGQKSIYKVISIINAMKLPNNYEDAKEVENKLNQIEGFDVQSIIQNMKENPKNDMYRKYLKLKFTSMVDEEIEKISNNDLEEEDKESAQLRENVLIDTIIDDYIMNNGEKPEDEKHKNYLNYIENFEIKNKNSYIKQIELLLKAVDPIKTQYYIENRKQIKFYCEVMKRFGIRYELEPTEPMESKEENKEQKLEKKQEQPKGEFEPGD